MATRIDKDAARLDSRQLNPSRQTGEDTQQVHAKPVREAEGKAAHKRDSFEHHAKRLSSEDSGANSRSPLDQLNGTSNELNAAHDMRSSVYVEDRALEFGNEKLEEAAGKILLSLSRAKRKMWHGYKQHPFILRAASGVLDVADAGEIVTISEGEREIDEIIEGLQGAKSAGEAKAILKRLRGALKKGEVIHRALIAAEVETTVQIAGLVQTTLEIIGSEVATAGIGGGAQALAAMGRFKKTADMARVAKTASLADEPAALRRAWEGAKLGARISVIHTAVEAGTGGAGQGTISLERLAKDALATASSMALTGLLRISKSPSARASLIQRIYDRFSAPGFKGLARVGRIAGTVAADAGTEALEEIVDKYVNQVLHGDYSALSLGEIEQIAAICFAGAGPAALKVGAIAEVAGKTQIEADAKDTGTAEKTGPQAGEAKPPADQIIPAAPIPPRGPIGVNGKIGEPEPVQTPDNRAENGDRNEILPPRADDGTRQQDLPGTVSMSLEDHAKTLSRLDEARDFFKNTIPTHNPQNEYLLQEQFDGWGRVVRYIVTPGRETSTLGSGLPMTNVVAHSHPVGVLSRHGGGVFSSIGVSVAPSDVDVFTVLSKVTSYEGRSGDTPPEGAFYHDGKYYAYIYSSEGVSVTEISRKPDTMRIYFSLDPESTGDSGRTREKIIQNDAICARMGCGEITDEMVTEVPWSERNNHPAFQMGPRSVTGPIATDREVRETTGVIHGAIGNGAASAKTEVDVISSLLAQVTDTGLRDMLAANHPNSYLGGWEAMFEEGITPAEFRTMLETTRAQISEVLEKETDDTPPSLHSRRRLALEQVEDIIRAAEGLDLPSAAPIPREPGGNGNHSAKGTIDPGAKGRK